LNLSLPFDKDLAADWLNLSLPFDKDLAADCPYIRVFQQFTGFAICYYQQKGARNLRNGYNIDNKINNLHCSLYYSRWFPNSS